MQLDDETERRLRYTHAPTAAYLTATRALTSGTVSVDQVIIIARIAQRMDFITLVQLVRETCDWCAWVPLLVLMLRARQRWRSEDLRAAEHNLRLLGRRLLDAQGFTPVQVDDVLAQAPRIQTAMQQLVVQPRRVPDRKITPE